MFRTVLVPLDGSIFGEHALPAALGIARRAEAKLRVVQVYQPLSPLYADLDPGLKGRCQAYLDGAVTRLAGESGGEVSSALLEGKVAAALHAEADAVDADLIVMTTHGRGPLARAWLGGVADELVRRVSRPILMVRPQETPPDLQVEPALKHVLIPLDGSPLAEQILEPALTLARLMRAQVTLLRVIKPMLLRDVDVTTAVVTRGDYSLLEELEELYQRDLTEATTYLATVAERRRDRSLWIKTEVVTHEQPAVAVLEYIRSHRIDLVALATHGRSGLPRLVLGSVADKVLRGASVPVLVHCPKGS